MVPLLKAWFKAQKRDLPWRISPTPYAVWISEVMLQQTQVSVVIPYFKRWMERFPSIKRLAAAPLEEVIKLWEGLGYYSRARQIHAGAKWLAEHCDGNLPDTAEALSKIKGLGPYTVGAILSFAFHQKAAAVDGNVMRVMTRLLCLEEEIGKIATQKKVKDAVFSLLPDKEPWVVMEGLIELGATVCQKQPKCDICPLQDHCQAFLQGKETKLPLKAAQPKTVSLTRYVSVLLAQGALLVKKEEGKKVMADLYEFPYFESEKEQRDFHQKIGAEQLRPLPVAKHSFTRFRATLYPVVCACVKPKRISGYEWVSFEALERLPFSSGHRKILHAFKKEKQ